MSGFSSASGKRLYGLLPEVYRNRDETEDLARYLDACGQLLDRLHQTLEQRLADVFPDAPEGVTACQDWLIPYFARLVDARLVSPHVAGQRAEVANAIAWRQRKGTLISIERIAEAVAQLEVEIQEGWKRVAVTPRIGLPLLPPEVYGVENGERFDKDNPLLAARHPGLPAATVDVRCSSQAVPAEPTNPAARRTRFAGVEYTWMQANPNGTPSHPGSFDDVARRTVDVRAPSWRQGHYHPKRLLLYAPPPMGMFPRATLTVEPAEFLTSRAVALSCRTSEEGSRVQLKRVTDHPVEIRAQLILPDVLQKSASGEDHPCAAITNLLLTEIEGLRFTETLSVKQGVTRLRRVWAKALIVETEGHIQPVLEAEDCLFGSIAAPDGLVRLESCTLLSETICAVLEARNCVFMGVITNKLGGIPLRGDIAFSRVPWKKAEWPASNWVFDRCVGAEENLEFFSDSYAGSGAGVFYPKTSAAICFGADDGREMGAFHRGRRGNPIIIDTDTEIFISLEQDTGYYLEDVVLPNAVRVAHDSGAPLRLRRVAISKLRSTASPPETPIRAKLSLIANDCLFEQIDAPGAPIQIEHCTVLRSTVYQQINASDCIFGGDNGEDLKKSSGDGMPTTDDCLRYSRLPQEILQKRPSEFQFSHCTSDRPIFVQPFFGQNVVGASDRGVGVLHPATPESLRLGAEDGGEMGGYHAWRYCLQDQAVIDKLTDYLPAGIQPVLVMDECLQEPPQRPR